LDRSHVRLKLPAVELRSVVGDPEADGAFHRSDGTRCLRDGQAASRPRDSALPRLRIIGTVTAAAMA
jgi:hypothetical protein